MIILTGASGGIGQALLPYLTEIDKVVGLYHSNISNLFTSEYLYYENVDIVDNASIEKFILKWKNELRDLTIIHLATKSIDGLALKCSESDWDNTFNVNLKGNFLLTKSLLPIMMNNSWGRIIQISSIVAANGDIGTLAYSSSKAGLRGFSNVLSKEYGRFNITSNILTLGYFNVGLINTLNEDKVKTILKKIPSGKLGHVKNIANAIKFIIDSDYLNGAYISIDGGI